MAWRGNADATRHPAEDDIMIIAYFGRCAQGPDGAWSLPARWHRLRSMDCRRDPSLGTPGARAVRW
jgi:hypothetical protein